MKKHNALKSIMFFWGICLVMVFYFVGSSNAYVVPGYSGQFSNYNLYIPPLRYDPDVYDSGTLPPDLLESIERIQYSIAFPFSPVGGFGFSYGYGYPYGYQQSYYPYGYQQQSYYPYGYQETFNPYGYHLAYPYSSLTYKDLWNTDFAGFIGSIDPTMSMTILGPLGLGLDPYTKDLLMPRVWGGP